MPLIHWKRCFGLLWAASHLHLQRKSCSLWNKERYWGQLQANETVFVHRWRFQARTSAGCSVHHMVSCDVSCCGKCSCARKNITKRCQSLCRILQITQSLTSMVLSLPEELTDELHQAVTFVSQLLSWCRLQDPLSDLYGWCDQTHVDWLCNGDKLDPVN